MQKEIVEWPYPVRYDSINRIDTDVLVIGGGIAGSWAAIKANDRGARVAVVEQAHASSAGPAGVDHWMYALDNPCCKVTADEFIEAHEFSNWGFINGIAHYVNYNTAYKALLELEKMGAKVRDTEDEFKGAPFRDDETKLLFAYDYETKHTIRVWGQTFKPALYAELRRRKVNVYDRIKVNSLLTEDGKQGSRAVGATGTNTRTGEFYVFKAKATVLCTGRAEGGARIWSYFDGRFSPTLRAPLSVGSGYAMAWEAGAELTLMEGRFSGGVLRFPAYGTGNPQNTWYPCTMIDAKGKEIPYVDKNGKMLSSLEQRVRPSLLRQKFFEPLTGTREPNEYRAPTSLSDTEEFGKLVKKGEYVLPLYADLPGMPEHERRAIFGLMVANEGKTWIVYRNLTQAGFDPDRDLLQSYGEWARSLDLMARCGFSHGYGGLVNDWNFKTSLMGLYAAGDILFSDMYFHDMAATGGSWAGSKAAEYAKEAPEPRIDEQQVEAERRRVYAPTTRTEGIDWKELNSGISGVMRVYCGDSINEEMLNIALTWLRELKEKEAKELVARNPHELVRDLEVLDILTFAEIWTHSALARKASCRPIGFYRLDYPKLDPPKWRKFITIKQKNGRIEVGELPLRYWLKPPYAPTYKENYEKYKPW